MRRDASRNRELIVAAARRLFAERGLEVTMDEIAREAGVGVGTAYRRFANRDALVDALFEERILDFVALAEAALEQEDPWDGLEHFLWRSAEMQAADRGLHELLSRDQDTLERVTRVRERVLPLVKRIATRALESGQARPDFAPLDVPILSLMLVQVVEFSREVDPELWRRYLALLLDGLRAGCEPRPLPHPPLSAGQLDRAMATPRIG